MVITPDIVVNYCLIVFNVCVLYCYDTQRVTSVLTASTSAPAVFEGAGCSTDLDDCASQAAVSSLTATKVQVVNVVLDPS